MISTITWFINGHFLNCPAVCIFQLATPWTTWFLSGRRTDQSKWLKASHCHSSSSKMNQTSDTAPSTTTQVTHAHKQIQVVIHTWWNGCHVSSVLFVVLRSRQERIIWRNKRTGIQTEVVFSLNGIWLQTVDKHGCSAFDLGLCVLLGTLNDSGVSEKDGDYRYL